MSERLDLQITSTTGREHVPFLRKNLLAAHGLLRTRVSELSVALIGDARMAGLHERYLGIAGPTDVLTFELDHDARGRVTAGEVVVCVPEAVRRAGRQPNAVRNELLLYALHGMLHLSGFDDTTGPGYRKMHRTEDRLLNQLGIGAVFSRDAADANDTPKATRPRRQNRHNKGGRR